MLTAIVGINWGDEGKGRMVDLFSEKYDIVAQMCIRDRPRKAVFKSFGGDDRTRTDYLYVANVSLSQVSYAPKSNDQYYICLLYTSRAPDYDDWKLNGDIVFWSDVLGCAFEAVSYTHLATSTCFGVSLS